MIHLIMTIGLACVVAGAAAAALACASPADSPSTLAPPVAPAFQTVSLLGDTLRALPLAADVREKYATQLADAQRAYEHTPTNVDSLIWYARRLGYLGQLRESIEIYTRGIALYPDNPWLYRHRGHRYISVRDFAAAVTDLERATALVQGKPDEIEPDSRTRRTHPSGRCIRTSDIISRWRTISWVTSRPPHGCRNSK